MERLGRAIGAGRRTGRPALVVLFSMFLVGGLLRQGRPGQIPLLDVWLFNAIYLVAALLCTRSRARERGMVLAWRLVALALISMVVANLYFSLVTVRAGVPTDLTAGTGAGDAGYALAYPASYVAVVLAVRARVRRFLSSMWWDGVITGLGLAAVVLSLAPVGRLTVERAAAADGLPALWYPAGDLLLLALLAAGAAVLGAHWDRMLLIAVFGLAVVACGDLIYVMECAVGSYREGGLSDTVNLSGVALLGWGASVREVPAWPGEAGLRVGWPVLALPAAATVASVVVMALPFAGLQPARSLAAGSVLAALARMFLTLREIRALGEVHRQARTDDLTGLPNRRAFNEHCDRAVRESASVPPVPSTLMLLDLDRFKEINDSLGHAAGDDLLVAVADRLRETLPADAVLARLGGDEFAVVLPGVAEEGALVVAADVARVLGRTFVIGRLSIQVTTSIGVAVTPQPAAGRRELLRRADVAMYRAKAERDGPVSYASVDAAGSRERLRTVEDLRLTLDAAPGAGRLVVHLQPQVRLVPCLPEPLGIGASARREVLARDVVGMEALVRWEHPVLGELQPASFLAAARAAGLMDAVTGSVLDLALTACRTWWDQGYPVPVSVNVSAADVHDRTLPSKVGQALRRHGLPARALVIELTEDTLMTDPGRARGVLEQLRAQGVGVSIDDYGTGYSSLAYLRQLPVDELKLDRAFIRDLPDDPVAEAIVRHTVELAHALGLRLVIEGVEDDGTLEAIRRLGGDIAQGFRMARPMPLAALVRWLDAHGPASAPYRFGVAIPQATPPILNERIVRSP